MNTGSQLGTRFPKPACSKDRNADVGVQTSQSAHAFPRSTQRLVRRLERNPSRMWATGLNPLAALRRRACSSAQARITHAEKPSTGLITGVGRRVIQGRSRTVPGGLFTRSFIAREGGRQADLPPELGCGRRGSATPPFRDEAAKGWATRLLFGHPVCKAKRTEPRPGALLCCLSSS